MVSPFDILFPHARTSFSLPLPLSCSPHSGTTSAHRCTIINNASSLTRPRLLKGFVCASSSWVPATVVAGWPHPSGKIFDFVQKEICCEQPFKTNCILLSRLFLPYFSNAGKHLMPGGQEVTVSLGK